MRRAATYLGKATDEINRKVDGFRRAQHRFIGAGGSGECAVGDGMGREGRASKHDEEADDARDDGDDGAHFPRIGHEAREHQIAAVPIVVVSGSLDETAPKMGSPPSRRPANRRTAERLETR